MLPTQNKPSWRIQRVVQINPLAYKLTKEQQLPNAPLHQLRNSQAHQLKKIKTQNLINSKNHQLINSPIYQLINLQTQKLKTLNCCFSFTLPFKNSLRSSENLG